MLGVFRFAPAETPCKENAAAKKTQTVVHVKAVCEEKGLDFTEQRWILIMDCYSVHISKEFLDWARLTHPNLILLYIPATYTAWLQPLDISFNYIFKTILKTKAATWLAQYVAAQITVARDSGKPVDIHLDTKLTSIRSNFCDWLADAFEQMSKRIAVISRGWNESRLGEAFVKCDEGRQGADFLKAQALEDKGELFASFTHKKNASLAEALLASHLEAHIQVAEQGAMCMHAHGSMHAHARACTHPCTHPCR